MSSSSGATQAFTSQEARDLERYAAQRRRELEEADHETGPVPNDGGVSPDFLKIIPCNTKAKLAFSELIEKKNSGALNEHHVQYLVDGGRGLLEKKHALQYKPSDETDDENWSDGSGNREINLGYFRVNFDCPSLTRTARWVLGKGSEQRKGIANRNVDILLAVPRSKYTRDILASHAFLKMHPESGVWMIYAAMGSSDVSASQGYELTSSPKATVWINQQKVPSKCFRCLTMLQTPLEIQAMQFTVQFALETFEDTQCFRELRDITLQKQEIQPPKTRISGIPLNSDERVGDLAIFSLGLGVGNFGSVYEGFSPVSGDLRAVKVFEIKKKGDDKSLRPETVMNEEFGDTPGLVRQYGWRNSNGDETVDVAVYPLKVYLVMEKGIGFHMHDWTIYGSGNFILELRLCQDLLKGLATIHSKGWIHRDITKQNILFFDSVPQRAALCDFGKLFFGQTHTDTRLAAWDYLPPEVVEGKSNAYYQSIDIWMLALALVLCWYPHVAHSIPRLRNQQITLNGVMVMRSRLQQESVIGLPHLLERLLSETPQSRPTATQALGHACFKQIPPEPAEAEGAREGKRTKMSDEEVSRR